MDENKKPDTEEQSVNKNNKTKAEADVFVIGKGFELDNEYTSDRTNTAKHTKKQSKGILKSIIWMLAIIIVSLCLAGSVIYAGADYLGIGFGRGDNCVVEIPQGASTPVIAEKLQEAGAVRWPLLFRFYSKIKHFDGQYKYGVYTFNNEAGYEDLAQMLMTEGAKAQSVSGVTIPEMSTVDEIAAILEEKGVCSKSDFIDAVQNGEYDYDFLKALPTETVYYRLEGYLFPDTYDFYNYDSEECAYLAVDKMLKTLDNKLTEDLKAKISESKYSFHQILTMASIVELESGGSPNEMANVAAVFYNRLESPDFSKLESSPTQKYPHGNGRYDTYNCEGLPPGPLCSPSIQSITAAISPTADFDNYFFVTDASMKFYYNRTLSEHNATISKLKKEKNWIGDR